MLSYFRVLKSFHQVQFVSQVVRSNSTEAHWEIPRVFNILMKLTSLLKRRQPFIALASYLVMKGKRKKYVFVI